MLTSIVSDKTNMYQFLYVKVFGANQYQNLLLLDDPGRVRSQITSLMYQIQRLDYFLSAIW